jgi:hypothetical protein
MASFWIPAFAGMTLLGPVADADLLSRGTAAPIVHVFNILYIHDRDDPGRGSVALI